MIDMGNIHKAVVLCIKELLEAVEKGQYSAINISEDEERKHTAIYSLDDKSITIIEQRKLLRDPKHIGTEERRDTVKVLHQEGKSQQNIANILNVSQKTISNDLKVLRNQGKISWFLCNC